MTTPAGAIRIQEGRCTGCGRCVAACTQKMFSLEPLGYRKRAVVRGSGECLSCTSCIAGCPVQALSASPLRNS